MRLLCISALLLTLGLAGYARACWEENGRRYGVSPRLLYAIAHVESGLNPLALGRNRNGTYDIGLMQINSAWLPSLHAYGIAERDLFDPCTNIHVGTWILARQISRLGYTWEAVGAYHSASPSLRDAYIARVQRQLAAIPPATPARRRAPITSAVASSSVASADTNP